MSDIPNIELTDDKFNDDELDAQLLIAEAEVLRLENMKKKSDALAKRAKLQKLRTKIEDLKRSLHDSSTTNEPSSSSVIPDHKINKFIFIWRFKYQGDGMEHTIHATAWDVDGARLIAKHDISVNKNYNDLLPVSANIIRYDNLHDLIQNRIPEVRLL
jgi:hypothetical protein